MRFTRSMWKVSFKVYTLLGVEVAVRSDILIFMGEYCIIEYMWHVYNPPFPLFSTSNWLLSTLPETNISPENGWLEDYFPFGKAYF